VLWTTSPAAVMVTTGWDNGCRSWTGWGRALVDVLRQLRKEMGRKSAGSQCVGVGGKTSSKESEKERCLSRKDRDGTCLE
jgi:hypothetical protein